MNSGTVDQASSRQVLAATAGLMLLGMLPAVMYAQDSNEIGFVERFALAQDRGKALEQLIPGTEEYFFYSCLHAQQIGELDRVEGLLAAWAKAHGETPLLRHVRARQMLLAYDQQPERTLEYLSRELGLHFDHQQPRQGTDPRLPTSLDQQLIARDRLRQQAIRFEKTTDGFTEHAFDWLITESLTPPQRRHLLQRLTLPDYPSLVPLVLADLKQQDSKGFGSLPIHFQLLREQLDACLAQMPELLNQPAFVAAYLSKLAPDDDTNWHYDHQAAIEYLDNAWAFVSRLAPVHNSLKVHILYRRLVLDRALGIHDKSRFMEYLALPRQAFYINPRLMESAEGRRYSADLNYTPPRGSVLPPVGNDEPLVRDYLQHFFLQETGFEPYEPFVDRDYLRSLFAETKITAGIGDPAQWYAMLRPDEIQALKERIDLDFAPENPTQVSMDEDVHLSVYVKNVDKLIVKIFHINTESYYRQHQQPIDTNIQLDGLVPNEQLVLEYDEPAERRVRRDFAFPQLSERGVYVIDFIGNGISSRAIVRRGTLRYLVRTGPAGQIFTILDEANQKVLGATLWIGGREFTADDDGTITIPFSTRPGDQPLVISHQGFAALHHVHHDGEQYELQAAFHVDRESLLKQREATVVVRPRLLLNGTPIDFSPLTNVQLLITAVDLDGIETTKHVDDLELRQDQETTYTFQVPPRLHHLKLSLIAQIEQLTTRKPVTLTDSHELAINEIALTLHTEDLHFLASGGEYLIEVLGRGGEPRPRQPVRVTLQHRDFTAFVNAMLQSDEQGRISLGPLEDIVWVKGSIAGGAEQHWWLPTDRVVHDAAVHGIAGQTLRIPLAGTEATRSELSLISTVRGTPVADWFDHLRLSEGYLELHDLQPGDYLLTLKRPQQVIRVRVTEGEVANRHVMGKTRMLEVRDAEPLHIQSAETRDGQLNVQLGGVSPSTRVHLFATRYLPAFDPFELSSIRDADPTWQALPTVISQYVAGRDIGDEYRYVLERKYARKFPGNMLRRPGLLLNPWAIRQTQTDTQAALDAEAFGASGPGEPTQSQPESKVGEEPYIATSAADLNFLNQASVVRLNLQPDENGRIELALSELGPHQHLHVVAVDDGQTSYRQVAVAAPSLETTDVRLILALDPTKHFAQRRAITLLDEGDVLVIPDVTTAKFEYYDSLASLYRLYRTLSDRAELAEFDFVTSWPQLSDSEKREKYSKYACHELNYFLYCRDRAFFDSTVQPYLANKLHKTFLDNWLLDRPLQSHLEPWRYEQLNIVERILLGERMEGEREPMRRHIVDLFEQIPPDLDRQSRLFETALRGGQLDLSSTLTQEIRQVEEEARTRLGAQLFSSPAPAAPQSADARGQEGGRQAGQAESDMLGREAVELRRKYRVLYVVLEQTREWVENNYYHLPQDQQNADLVRVNAYWRDLAEHLAGQRDTPFLSSHWPEASHSFTEIMLALASIDLPFQAKPHSTELEGSQLTLTGASPLVVFHQQIQEAETGKEESTAILVSQNLFRLDDRHETVDGVPRDKFVTDEFLVGTVYGCRAVVTNTSSGPLKVDVLLQIPQGAIPVNGSHYTRSLTIDLAAYGSQSIEYAFYFPTAGTYTHFPVHVTKEGRILGFAEPAPLNVVDQLSQLDTDSWAHVSQFGTDDDVLNYLQQHNVQELDLDRIAFRMKDKAFFARATELLGRRHAYQHTLWSYSIKHKVVARINEFLGHAEDFVQQVGPSITSTLLTVEPVERHFYQHREYWPLINARAHQLGRQRRILNASFHRQYHELMRQIAYQPALDQSDLMAVTYAMLLQERIEEALDFFARVEPDQLETRLQYDYFDAYLDCFSTEPQRAAAIVARYVDYPVDRWRQSFAAVGKMLDELQGESTEVVDPSDRDQVQGRLAAKQASFDLTLDGTSLVIDHRNLDAVQVNFYLMDLELLFSRNPFVTEFAEQFSHIFPNESRRVELSKQGTTTRFELPESLHHKNVLVEVVAAGQSKSASYYSNSLVVEIREAYGQLHVFQRATGRGLPTVYVKVYAEMRDGTVQFYKDGYTDLRGIFDYSSLSTSGLDAVKRFSILVLSDQHGAVVREAKPPKQ